MNIRYLLPLNHQKIGKKSKKINIAGKREEMEEVLKKIADMDIKGGTIHVRKRKISMKTPWNKGYITYTSEHSLKISSRAFAHFMNKGYKLYRDLSSNHQPIAYFLSSITQKLLKPDSLFLLIKRNREAVFFHSFAWSLFLFFQFERTYYLFFC